jgi:hypothetical protein
MEPEGGENKSAGTLPMGTVVSLEPDSRRTSNGGEAPTRTRIPGAVPSIDRGVKMSERFIQGWAEESASNNDTNPNMFGVNWSFLFNVSWWL